MVKYFVELVENEHDLSCAIYLLSGIKDLGTDLQTLAPVMGANAEKVQSIIDVALTHPRENKRVDK